jgi:integrase
MAGDRRLHVVLPGEDPIWRLWEQLPPQWRGPVIGEGIDNWPALTAGRKRLNLTGLPSLIAAELAWMAHWQVQDGLKVATRDLNHLATILRHAQQAGRAFPPSMRAMDWSTASALQGWYYATYLGRLPTTNMRNQLRAVFGYARLALLAHCHEGPWWQLDEWNPRCDPRIPLQRREPSAHHRCAPSAISIPWLREAAKWHLGTMLESGTLRWTTVRGRVLSLRRFDAWLAHLGDGSRILADPAEARQHAAGFARWLADPHSRLIDGEVRRGGTLVDPREVNQDLRAVAELFAFITDTPVESRATLGAGPWQQITDAHVAAWSRQITHVPPRRALNDEQYVDDHALAQIAAALPLLGLPSDEQMVITFGDGRQITAAGLGDPQAMRMILVQILTGRRASEVRTCDSDCIEPVPDTTVTGTDGEPVSRFRYAQTKIDTAPDSILVDREVSAVIEEQQHWARQRFSGLPLQHLFLQRRGNRNGTKPYAVGSYNQILVRFSDLVQIVDSKGRPVRISHTHRFRHTKFTRLAELGLPIHVLQRYAGHATPTMSMHYIAQREEHAELAFLATTKLRADGTAVRFSREDHDSLHLFERADRFLPHGWCLLPPAQTCSKGNACLTCSVFVTDATHRSTLERQLADTEQLIARTTATFQQRHGQPMPDDNVWLAQRRAEHAALTQLLATMDAATPGRAVQGGGCGATTPGPVPLTLDTSRARRTRP